MNTDLTWFYRLPFADQVSLLRDPRQTVRGDLVSTLFLDRALMGSKWTSNDGGIQWTLDPDAAQQLISIRQQLNEWWSTLTSEEQAYIAEHRAGELDGEHRSAVQRASLDPVSDDGHLVVVVSDNKTGRFRLPEMIRIYAELRAAS